MKTRPRFLPLAFGAAASLALLPAARAAEPAGSSTTSSFARIEPIAPPPATAGGGKWKRTLGTVLVATGGVTMAAGAFFGLRTRKAETEVRAFVSTGAAQVVWSDAQRAKEAEGRRSALTSTILLGAGALTIIGGSLLHAWGKREAAESMGVAAAPGGVLFSWRGRL